MTLVVALVFVSEKLAGEDAPTVLALTCSSVNENLSSPLRLPTYPTPLKRPGPVNEITL